VAFSVALIILIFDATESQVKILTYSNLMFLITNLKTIKKSTMKVASNMAILLWLRNAKNNLDLATIMVRITINGKRIDWSLGKQVNPDHWISGAGILKSAAKESKLVNPYLNQVRGDIQTHFNILTTKCVNVTPEMVKNAFFGIQEETKKEKTLLEAFNYHNLKFKEKAQIGKVSMKSWERLEIAKNKVIAFMNEVLKCQDKNLTELKMSFVTEYEHFLSVNQKMQTNTVMKYIKILKQILNYAVALDWLQSNPFNQFKCTYRNPDRVVLSQDEIDVLYFKVMPNERLEQVKDIFLFACYTGYAFSDIESLSPDAVVKGIDGEIWIHANRVKTDVRENVMLLDIPLKIIEKYKNNKQCMAKGTLLPAISNQKYNAYLKEIAALCNINKHLTSHIARHTFATTVTLANGISLESVSAMLGHASIKTTQIYAKVVQSKLSTEMKGLKAKMNSANLQSAVGG
jgi:site-specific recombinase XerD